jgi:tetratricopeptide (TPR) repeat protein
VKAFAIAVVMAWAALAVPAHGASPEEAFDQACHDYEQGKWDQAAEGFRSLLRYGLEDPRIEFNLANSEYKRGRIGEAILHYEKARRLDPADPDIAANLAIARARIRDVIDDPAAAGPLSAWRSFQDRLGVAPQTLMALAGFWLVAGIVTWCASRAGGFTPGWVWGLSAAILVTVIVTLSARATWLRLEGTPRAVILKSSVEALAGPGLNNTALFTLHEGAAVEVRAERPGWLQVALPNGLTGWVGTDAAARI